MANATKTNKGTTKKTGSRKQRSDGSAAKASGAGAHPVESAKTTQQKIKNKRYEKELANLQIELVKLQ